METSPDAAPEPSQPISLSGGFTLLELVVVILIISVVVTLLGMRTGTFQFWNDEAFIRKLSETISFLHYQALADQQSYQLELNLNDDTYKIGQLTQETVDPTLEQYLQDAGNLSRELAYFLNPSSAGGELFSAPLSFPSLADPVKLPNGMRIQDVRTMRGKIERPESGMSSRAMSDDKGIAYIRFSPRGFSEFAVIHLRQENDAAVTIVVNPFTGTTDVIRVYQDFEWTFNQNKEGDEGPRGI